MRRRTPGLCAVVPRIVFPPQLDELAQRPAWRKNFVRERVNLVRPEPRCDLHRLDLEGGIAKRWRRYYPHWLTKPPKANGTTLQCLGMAIDTK